MLNKTQTRLLRALIRQMTCLVQPILDPALNHHFERLVKRFNKISFRIKKPRK